MKIGCEHCGAAYAVRDDKIAGRKLRLRCKRCGEPIAVDARDLDAEQGPDVSPAAAETSDVVESYPEIAPPMAAPDHATHGELGALDQDAPSASGPAADADAVWHLALDDRTQGPYTAAELAGMLAAGSAGAELLCWREGMDDWLPLGQIGEIADQLSASTAPAIATEGLAAGADTFAADADPFAAAAEPGSLGRAAGSAVDAPVTSDPRVSAEQIMGSNSLSSGGGTVQFSMDEIRALSSASAPPRSITPSPGLPGHASGDSSGLIDMRALVAMEQEQPAAEDVPDERLGTPTSTTLDSLTPMQLAPLAPSRNDGFRTRVFAGVSAFGLVLAAAVGVLAVLHEPAVPVEVATAAATAPAPQPAATPAAEPADEEPPAEAAEEASTDSEATAEVEDAQPSDEVEAAPPADAPKADAPAPAKRAARSTKRSAEKSDKARAKARAKPKARAKAAARTKASKGDDLDDIMKQPAKRSGDSSIDDLLLNAVRNGGKSKDKAAAKTTEAKKQDSDLPKTPSRDQIRGALGQVSKKVKSTCNGAGVATADITIKNSGRVSGVKVSGVSGASKTCVERAVKGARFPKFAQPSFNVKFPFKLPG